MADQVDRLPVPETMKKFLDKLTLGQIIRYTYAGLLFSVILHQIEAAEFVKVLHPLGRLSPLLGILSGILVYALYKEFFGEFLLYPARHMLHTLFGQIIWPGPKGTCGRDYG